MALDKRIIRVGISINDTMHYYESKDGFKLDAFGAKYADPTESTCEVHITGAASSTRDFILTETSPFLPDRKPVFCLIEAGRESTGYFKLFEGSIVKSRPTAPPESKIVLTVKNGFAINSDMYSLALPGNASLSTIANRVAFEIKKELFFNATDKQINNFGYTGGGMGLVRRLSEAGGVMAYLDDNALIVHNKDNGLDARFRVLDKDSGMIGVPELTDVGCTVKYLVDGESILGGYIRIESTVNKAATGNYRIGQLDFGVSSHGNDFFYEAKGIRLK